MAMMCTAHFFLFVTRKLTFWNSENIWKIIADLIEYWNS
jgi:hypothetical protein